MACLMLVNNKTWACADMGDEHLAEVFSIYSNDYTYSNYERLMKYWAAYTGDKTPSNTTRFAMICNRVGNIPVPKN